VEVATSLATAFFVASGSATRHELRAIAPTRIAEAVGSPASQGPSRPCRRAPSGHAAVGPAQRPRIPPRPLSPSRSLDLRMPHDAPPPCAPRPSATQPVAPTPLASRTCLAASAPVSSNPPPRRVPRCRRRRTTHATAVQAASASRGSANPSSFMSSFTFSIPRHRHAEHELVEKTPVLRGPVKALDHRGLASGCLAASLLGDGRRPHLTSVEAPQPSKLQVLLCALVCLTASLG